MFPFINHSRPCSADTVRSRQVIAASLALFAITSCSDSLSAPAIVGSGEILSVCHVSVTSGSLIQIYASDLPMHQSHGDYRTRLIVEKDSKAVGDGVHFARIGDAVAAARELRLGRNETSSALCQMTISVGPGVFQGSVAESTDPTFERFPLVIDVPGITLAGSFRMGIDAGGRATGEPQDANVTTLAATPGLVRERLGGAQNFRAEPLIVVTDAAGGLAGNGAVIEGFVFQSGNSADAAEPGGIAVFAMRIEGLVFRGNRIEEKFSEPITVRSSNARISENYLTGRGGSCAVCLSGPGTFDVNGNRLMGPGGIPGILIFPVSILPVPLMVAQQVLPESSVVTAYVDNNEIRNHQQKPSGAGLRIGALGVLSSDVVSSARVVASNNTFVNNTFGVMVEAAFPLLNTALKGDIELTLEDNTIIGNCQADVYVAFARNSTGLGLISAALFQSEAFLHNSTFTLKLGGDVEWEDVWYANPEGFGNTLIVDNHVIPSGTRVAYDAARVCTP
jgi:hypothetical protein